MAGLFFEMLVSVVLPVSLSRPLFYLARLTLCFLAWSGGERVFAGLGKLKLCFQRTHSSWVGLVTRPEMPGEQT